LGGSMVNFGTETTNSSSSQLLISNFKKHPDECSTRTRRPRAGARLSLSSTHGAGGFLSRSMEDLNIGFNSSSFHTAVQRKSSENDNSDEQGVAAQGSPFHPVFCLPEQLTTQRLVPECCIKVWAAEMVMCLESLHKLGLAYG
jgi:hypothetical protein